VAAIEDMTAAPGGAAVPLGGWRVMIVEDNRPVAALHKRLVDSMPSFRTVHVAWNGEQAFRALPSVLPNVIILDLTMPGGDGLSFLARVRAEEVPVEVIVVTASRSGATIQEAMRHGVIDYLVKPFTPQRLRQALSTFAVRQRALTRPELTQEDVDAVKAYGAVGRRRLPKGLKEATLSDVLAVLQESRRALAADEVGRKIGVARVTARRYLEYLELVGAAQVVRETGGPGRPRNRYRATRTGTP
jgi:two-component system response regulator DctR